MKPILVFPYHDPKPVYAQSLLKNAPLLKKHFSQIILSATPQTVEKHPQLLSQLKQERFLIVENIKENAFADHHRNGILAAVECKSNANYIYYGYIDRILFAIETKHNESFLADISKEYNKDFILFSRSDFAWQTHPREYYLLENSVTEVGDAFIGEKIDWAWCGALIKKDLAKKITQQSEAQDFSVLAEYILLALKEQAPFRNIKVDWLEWEDPYWDKNKNANKKISKEEKIFRLTYCINSAKLFLDGKY